MEKSRHRDKSDFVEAECSDILLSVKRISEILPESESAYLSSNFVIKGAIERNLQLISDRQTNILYALYSGRLRISGDYDTLLKYSDVFGKKLLEKTKLRRSLRNMLVHNYVDSILDKDVFIHASSLEDVIEFVEKAREIVASKEKSKGQ
ncbi:MAG: HepT-like ribonuclease domain-containing protein [Candidatus Micrarchaeia archaeon]